MRTHFVKITVFFIFFALATAVALPVASPKVSGSWHGDWTSPEGFRYEADMQLTVDKDNNVTGEIHWTLRKSPRSEEQEKVGLTGVEHVKGAFAPGARVLRMEGTSLDDPKHILGMDKYRLLLSDDGTRLGGSTSNHDHWNAQLLLERPQTANSAMSTAEKYLKDAAGLRWAHQYEAAIEKYRKALAANPKLAQAHIGMGIAYVKMRGWDDAEKYLKEGLAIAPRDVNGLRYLAQTYEGLERHSDAVETLQRALALAPNRYDLHYFLGRAYDGTNRKDDAKLEYGKAEALAQVATSNDPGDIEAYWVLEEINNHPLDKYEEAIRWGQKQIELDPGDAEAHSLLGANYYNLKKTPQAIAEFQTAIQLDPENFWYHAQLGAGYKQAGRNEDANTEYREAIRVAPVLIGRAPKLASNYNFVANLYTWLNQPEDALTWYKKAVEAAPDNFDAHFTLADKYLDLKRYSDAVPEYQAATRIKPNEPGPWATLTNCYGELKQWDDVLSAGEHADKLKSTDSVAHNTLGIAYYKLKRYPEAIAQFQESIRLTPTSDDWKDSLVTEHQNLGRAYLYSGNRDGATQEYNTLTSLDAAKAAELQKEINPPQQQPAAQEEPPPNYEYFRVRGGRSETEIPPGHENYGYYIYNHVTNADSGQQCTLSCWYDIHGGTPECFRMPAGQTYNVRRYSTLYHSRKSGDYYGHFTELEISGRWVGVNGCSE